jgi:hypothetical protein
MKAIEMNIYEFVDMCSNYQDGISQEISYQLYKEYSPGEWVDAVMFFVTNLDKQHRIPSSVVNNLIGIGIWYKEHHGMTHEQKIYLSNNFIRYWDQIDGATFIQLNL